mgnify:FL=1
MNVRNGAAVFSKASVSSILSSINGNMPVFHACSNVGAIINALKKSAKLIITILGGDCCVPRAVLKSDKTTTIRVNEVIVTNSPGAKDKTAIKATICKIRAVVDPPGSPMSKVRVWA